MQSRRVFIKLLFGLAAVALPWTGWPAKFERSLKRMNGRPPVKIITPPPKEPDIKVRAEALERTAMDDIIALTQADMQGRRAGSIGEAKAADYLAKQLSMLGLKPMGDQGSSFSQVFTIPPVVENVINGRLTFSPGEVGVLRTPSVNLLGSLVGENAEEVVLLSAHYDHLGIYRGQIYPGANDNASGVGCVLDVIRRLIREGNTPKRTIVVAFWSAEEMGFVGSDSFVQNPTFPLDQIKAVLNVDTVGNGMVGDFALWSDGENLASQVVQKAAAEAGASALPAPHNGHNSDQVSFAKVNIPAVTLMARDWLIKNHTPQDTIGFVKSDQVRLASEIIYRAVKILAY